VAWRPKKPADIPADADPNDREAFFQRQVLFESSDRAQAAEFHRAVVAVHRRVTQELKLWEMIGMLLTTTGGGLGLLAFGPLCEGIGRRPAFLVFHLGGLAAAILTFQLVHGTTLLWFVLPVFGFLTLGMHAGYAIYFPELYPTRLRGTGAGFCFNAGRIIVPPLLIASGALQDAGLTKENAFSILSLLYLVGILALVFAPETKGQELLD
jgi:MFS family permease